LPKDVLKQSGYFLLQLLKNHSKDLTDLRTDFPDDAYENLLYACEVVGKIDFLGKEMWARAFRRLVQSKFEVSMSLLKYLFGARHLLDLSLFREEFIFDADFYRSLLGSRCPTEFHQLILSLISETKIPYPAIMFDKEILKSLLDSPFKICIDFDGVVFNSILFPIKDKISLIWQMVTSLKLTARQVKAVKILCDNFDNLKASLLLAKSLKAKSLDMFKCYRVGIDMLHDEEFAELYLLEIDNLIKAGQISLNYFISDIPVFYASTLTFLTNNLSKFTSSRFTLRKLAGDIPTNTLNSFFNALLKSRCFTEYVFDEIPNYESLEFSLAESFTIYSDPYENLGSLLSKAKSEIREIILYFLPTNLSTNSYNFSSISVRHLKVAGHQTKLDLETLFSFLLSFKEIHRLELQISSVGTVEDEKYLLRLATKFLLTAKNLKAFLLPVTFKEESLSEELSAFLDACNKSSISDLNLRIDDASLLDVLESHELSHNNAIRLEIVTNLDFSALDLRLCSFLLEKANAIASYL
jgi:hypothetical protein